MSRNNFGQTIGVTNPQNDAEIDGRLRYRLLTGGDTSEFCQKVSQALADGYVLSGSPAITHDGERTITAQAVVLPGDVVPVPANTPTSPTFPSAS